MAPRSTPVRRPAADETPQRARAQDLVDVAELDRGAPPRCSVMAPRARPPTDVPSTAATRTTSRTVTAAPEGTRSWRVGERTGPSFPARGRQLVAPTWGPPGSARLATVLTAVDVKRSHGAQVVLDGVTVSIGPRSRIGLVGPNGIGKSTLLRILAGLEAADGGRVERSPAALTVGYLPQESDAEGDETLRAYLARRTGVGPAEAALEAATDTLAVDPEGEGVVEVYSEALDRFLALGGDDLEARAGAVLDDVGLPADRLDVPVGALSGGQAGPRCAGRHPPRPVRRLPPGRADQRPRLRRPRSPGTFRLRAARRRRHGQPRPGVPRPDRRADPRDRGGEPGVGRVRRRVVRLGRGEARWPAAALRALRGLRRVRGPACRTGCAPSVRGPRRATAALKKNPRTTTRRSATSRVNRTEKQAGKVQDHREGVERLDRDAVDKPFEPWELQLSFAGGRAQRRRGRPPGRRRGRAGLVPPRAGRASRSAGRSGWRWSGPTAVASRRSSAPCSARCPLAPAPAAWAPA